MDYFDSIIDRIHYLAERAVYLGQMGLDVEMAILNEEAEDLAIELRSLTTASKVQ